MAPRSFTTARAIRLVGIGLIIGLGAYWAGSHYGPARTPATVNAVRNASTLPPAQPEPPLDATETENVRIYREASPAVANIVTRTVEYDFFYNPVPIQGAGSGFLIDKDGHILTNYHVVQGAQQIEVTLGDQSGDKTRSMAKLIGEDPRNDIALIQIDLKGKSITPLTLGDSRSLVVGQRALAIGNPFGFSSTLTTGIVSALGRTVQTSETTIIDEAIQTDAAINRGNSGGPLLDSHGQVIGINSAIYASQDSNTAGIAFAIPVNTARRVAEDLIKYGHVRRATLGAEGRPLFPQLAQVLGLSTNTGILIEKVEPNGPAAQAGIRGGTRRVVGLQELRAGGDVLIAIDGKEITNQVDLNLLLNRAEPGQTVKLTIIRDGKRIDIPVKLGTS
jgi:S1-C subfamily serine protease